MEYKRLSKEDMQNLSFVEHCVIDGGEVRSIEIQVEGENYLFTAPYSSISLSVKAPDSFSDKYKVVGNLLKDQYFDTEEEAKEFISSCPIDELEMKQVFWNNTRNCEAS